MKFWNYLFCKKCVVVCLVICMVGERESKVWSWDCLPLAKTPSHIFFGSTCAPQRSSHRSRGSTLQCDLAKSPEICWEVFQFSRCPCCPMSWYLCFMLSWHAPLLFFFGWVLAASCSAFFSAQVCIIHAELFLKTARHTFCKVIWYARRNDRFEWFWWLMKL